MSSGLPEERASIVTAIEDDIIFGRLPPGLRLVEDVLMARFSATRHAIRQALSELERIGIVTRERNIGAAVRSYSREEVLEIYQVRELLQRNAALMIRLPVSQALISQLEALNERFAQNAARGDLRGVHESNDAFHLTLFGACGNTYLVRCITDCMTLSLPVRAKSLADPEAFQNSLRQHETMIRLLRDQDSWALAQLCVEHVWPSKHDYLERTPTPPAQCGLRSPPTGGRRSEVSGSRRRSSRLAPPSGWHAKRQC
jgi:DNA-binding GntR family transcriptional regulator